MSNITIAIKLDTLYTQADMNHQAKKTKILARIRTFYSLSIQKEWISGKKICKEAGSCIFKAPEKNVCLRFSLLKCELVYFLSTQDPFQVAETNGIFPAEYANATETHDKDHQTCVFGRSGSLFKDTWRLK